jgi:hypothetical protein
LPQGEAFDTSRETVVTETKKAAFGLLLVKKSTVLLAKDLKLILIPMKTEN